MTGISCIKVGDICLAVDSNDPDFSQYFRRFYCHSIFNSTPDIWVDVDVWSRTLRLENFSES